MAIELNISAEDIDQLVRDSIMKSGFGAAVQKAVVDSLNGYNSPITKSVQAHLLVVCERLLKERFSSTIEESVSAALSRMITREMLDNIVEKTVSEMMKAAKERY